MNSAYSQSRPHVFPVALSARWLKVDKRLGGEHSQGRPQLTKWIFYTVFHITPSNKSWGERGATWHEEQGHVFRVIMCLPE